MEGTKRLKPSESTTVQICINIQKKKRKRKRKTTECLSLHRQPEAMEGGESDACFTGREWTGQPKVVLLPRLGLCSRTRWSHVELHVLNLPITQVADQVIDLSPGDLPVPYEDTYQCWVVNEGMSSAGPPPGGVIRTSHPRLHPVHPPFSSPTLEASPRQKSSPLEVHLESSVGHGGATN